MHKEIVLTSVAKSIIKSTLSRFIWLNKKKVIINKGKKVDIKYPHSINLIKYYILIAIFFKISGDETFYNIDKKKQI